MLDVVAGLAGLVRLIKIVICKTRRSKSNTWIPIDASVIETIIESRNLATHRRDTWLGGLKRTLLVPNAKPSASHTAVFWGRPQSYPSKCVPYAIEANGSPSVIIVYLSVTTTGRWVLPFVHHVVINNMVF